MLARSFARPGKMFLCVLLLLACPLFRCGDLLLGWGAGLLCLLLPNPIAENRDHLRLFRIHEPSHSPIENGQAPTLRTGDARDRGLVSHKARQAGSDQVGGDTA